MVLVNLTDQQYKDLISPPSLLDQLFSNPFFYILIIVLILAYVILKIKGKKNDPSTQPFYYRNLRKDTLRKEYDKRFNTLGTKLKNCLLEKGSAKIGVLLSIEHDKVLFHKQEIDKKTRKTIYIPDFWYRVDRFKFRKYGLWSWVKALFGYGYNYMTITPDSYKVYPTPNGKKRIYYIDPMVHLINDSDVWTLSDLRTINSNLEYLYKAEHEGLLGSEIDLLRRQSVHMVNVSATLEKLSHESEIKEKERRNRIQPYT